MEDELDLRRYALVVWRRRAIVAAFALAAALIAGLAAAAAPPLYETSALLLVAAAPLQVGGTADEPGPKIGTVLRNDIPTETLVAFARSRATLRRLAEQLGSAAPRNGEITDALNVQVVRNTNLVELRVRGTVPEQVAKTANQWAALVASASLDLFSAEAQQSFTFFDGRLKETQARLEAAEEERRQFEMTSTLELLKARERALTDQVATYESRLRELEVLLPAQEAQLAAVNAQLTREPRTFPLAKSITEDPLLQGAASAVSKEDLAAVSRLRLRDEETNPVYVSLRAQRTRLTTEISGQRVERAQIRRVLLSLAAALRGLRGQIAAQQLLEGQFARRTGNETQLYNVLLQRREEARIASASRTGSVKVVADAILPGTPLAKHTASRALLAGAGGLVLGVLAALAVEALQAGRAPVVRPAPAAGATPQS